MTSGAITWPAAAIVIVAIVALVLAADTLVRLWTERHRLSKEDLNDDDRAFAWRLVVFIVFPLITLVDMRVSAASTILAQGHALIPHTLFTAGQVVQVALALLLIPALILRPHPFFATFIGYTVAFILSLDLIFHPLMSVLFDSGIASDLLVYPVHFAIAIALVAALRRGPVRMWFSELTRPQAASELRQCLALFQQAKEEPNLTLRLGLLYLRAGLKSRAKAVLRHLTDNFPGSIQATLLGALLAFQQRKYGAAQELFKRCSDFDRVEGELKAALLAAAACSAFAAGKSSEALNFSDSALEFEDNLTARMVKVDAYLAQGKKEQAAREIMVAMHHGLNFDLRDKVPVDIDKVYSGIIALTLPVEEEAVSR
jgi:hypothetical protein